MKFSNLETGQFEESLRPRDVPNPKLQNVCKAMKHRALHPNTPLPAFEDKLLGDLLEPNALLLKRAKLVFCMLIRYKSVIVIFTILEK